MRGRFPSAIRVSAEFCARRPDERAGRAGMPFLVAFAVVGAVLYGCLLPLWEGFDEAFHYAYVESLAVGRRLPVLGESCVSAGIASSLELAPVSHVLHRVLPGSTSFDQWFSLAPAERARRRDALLNLPPALRGQPDPRRNYEAHQPPLAYAILAPLDAAAGSLPLPERVLLLRLSGAILALAALFPAALLLCRELGLSRPFSLAALACILLTQMWWAAVAHVANDWLAIPIATLLFALVLRAGNGNRDRSPVLAALALAAGLLTKAWFLAFAPVVGLLLFRTLRLRKAVAALLVCAAIAGPWYARNWALYRNFTGTQEAFDGIGPADALAALPRIAWPQTIAYMARSALWTGNNSFGTFSRGTLNLELLLLAAALALYARNFRKAASGERWLLAAVLSFCAALAYATCTIWVHTKGASAGASPWYSTALLPAVLALAFAGLQRAGRAGRCVAAALVAVCAWICVLTYLAKLLPLYSGFPIGKTTLRTLLASWSDPARSGVLSVTALAPATFLYSLAAIHAVLSAAVAALVLKGLLYPPVASSTISPSEKSR